MPLPPLGSCSPPTFILLKAEQTQFSQHSDMSVLQSTNHLGGPLQDLCSMSMFLMCIGIYAYGTILYILYTYT